MVVLRNIRQDLLPMVSHRLRGLTMMRPLLLLQGTHRIRLILALSAQMGWKIHQMDVKTAFLNGKIEEEVYIEQPEGFETFNPKSHVC